jgi:RNA recognition motif-containing protein
MAKKLFVGNLPFSMTDDQLTQIFSAHGTIVSANIVKDRYSGKSKGYAFVEFDTDEAAAAAMVALDNTDQGGRMIAVKEALARPEKTEEFKPTVEPVTEAVMQPVEKPVVEPVEEKPIE